MAGRGGRNFRGRRLKGAGGIEQQGNDRAGSGRPRAKRKRDRTPPARPAQALRSCEGAEGVNCHDPLLAVPAPLPKRLPRQQLYEVAVRSLRKVAQSGQERPLGRPSDLFASSSSGSRLEDHPLLRPLEPFRGERVTRGDCSIGMRNQ